MKQCSYLVEERVHPFREGLLLNVQALLLQGLYSAGLELDQVLALRHFEWPCLSVGLKGCVTNTLSKSTLQTGFSCPRFVFSRIGGMMIYDGA